MTESEAAEVGSVTTKQVANVTVPRAELDRIWSPAYLERLARTYWRFLTRVSLGLLRVLYSESAREVVLLARPLVLLRFHPPEYEAGGNRGTVTWRIDRGILVAPGGRGKGFLRISVERPAEDDGGDMVTGRVTSEVASFYPTIAGWGWFARIGRHLYRITQLRLHVSSPTRSCAAWRGSTSRRAASGLWLVPEAKRPCRPSARAASGDRGSRGRAGPCPSASASRATRSSRPRP